jgi:streptogramin lyase
MTFTKIGENCPFTHTRLIYIKNEINLVKRLFVMLQLDESKRLPVMATAVVLCIASTLVAVGMIGSPELNILMTPVFAFPPDQQAVVQSTWNISGFVPEIGDMASDFAGNTYFSKQISNKIARLEPTTNMITEWDISGDGNATARPTGIAFDPVSGSVYFTASGTDKIGKLEPTTNMITEWDISGNSSTGAAARPTGIAFDSVDGSVYFTASGTNKIGKLEPTTNMVTEWSLPNSSKSLIQDIIIQPDLGSLYFIESNGSAIRKLETAANTFTEWTLPISSSNISDITFGFDSVYFTESGTNQIGKLEPATNMITEWDISGSGGNSTGEPKAVAFDPTTGSVYFTESGTNTIGRLEPSRDAITKWQVDGNPLSITVTSAGSVFYVDDQGLVGRLG